MTPETLLRRAAFLLLRSMVRVAPVRAADWGKAMLAEFEHIKGAWAAWSWACGCTTVLAKQAALSIFASPWRTDKGARRAAVIFVVLTLLFLAAPTFRQALNISMTPWRIFLERQTVDHPTGWPDPELRSLIQKAEGVRDANALAFAAVRLTNAVESARVADEAVRIDPSLTWVYSVVGIRNWRITEIPSWINRLSVSESRGARMNLR